MSNTIDVRVPDIGDFQDVPVIEVLVKPGDTVKKNDSLITLESDKASMEVPSPADGVVATIGVKVGDKVSEGTAILTLEGSERASTGSAALRQAQGDTTAQVPTSSVMPSAVEAPPSNVEAKTAEIEVRVPDIGDFKDVPVIEVLVKPGDAVKKNDSLVTLESEKASMEVPSPADGTVGAIRVSVGDKVSEGSVILTLQGQLQQASTGSAALRQAQDDTKGARDDTKVAQDDTKGAQDDTGAAAAPSVMASRVEPPSSPAETRVPDKQSANGTVHASPSIRRFARELGVDLHAVSPSGPNGRVTREDVQNFVKRTLQNGAVSAPAAAPGMAGLRIAPWPKVDFAQFGEIERKPLSRIKKISGPNLHRNWVMIPHVTHNDDADVTDLETFRTELNAELGKSGVKVTMLAFLIKASVAALKKFPDFNSSLDGDELVYKKYYNIGFAADTPGGLVVPVIKDADKKGIADLAQETAELAAKARDGKLALSAMQGGTFTISSLGSIGGTYFTPIINAPEVAILGACRAAMRPVWNGETFVPRLMQPLSLSYDHRVIDGAAAARFVAYLISVLSDLRRALL
jgi:pyruvate dehydrogenase E2 component (dihydrolipoamide acetyltransferase)